MKNKSLKTIRIKDLGLIITGNTPPTSKRHYYGDLYPLIKPTDMQKDGRFIGDTQEKLSQQGYDLFKNKILPKNVTCVVTIGTIGKLCLTKEPSFCNQAVNSIIVHKDKYNALYVFYLMKTKIPQVKFLSSGTASGRENVSKSAFENIKIKVCPLSTQNKIASILSAYDDLIENNTRRIKILETMAQALYQEWFVKFRFPGHEQVNMVESDLGLIPEGWEVKKLSEVTSYIRRGIAPKYDDESKSIVINQKCIRNGRLNLELARKHSKKVPDVKFVIFGDVLVNSTGVGTLGRVTQVYENLHDCTVDTHVTIVRPVDSINIDYFGISLLQLQQHFEHMGAGSTGQTELNRHAMGEVNFLVPPISLQNSFSQIVSPMRKFMIQAFIKNHNLRKTRDLLLPKLISGQIDVENLDIDTGELAA